MSSHFYAIYNYKIYKFETVSVHNPFIPQSKMIRI